MGYLIRELKVTTEMTFLEEIIVNEAEKADVALGELFARSAYLYDVKFHHPYMHIYYLPRSR